MIKPIWRRNTDDKHADALIRFMADELYRRAATAVILFIPGLYLYYLALEDTLARNPAVGRAFSVMVVLVAVRIAFVFGIPRLRGGALDPKLRVAIFVATSGMLGLGMAAINTAAVPYASVEQIVMVITIVTSTVAVAVLSLGPSIGSYVVYMTPMMTTLTLTAPAALTSDKAHLLQLILLLAMLSLLLMSIHTYFSLRKVALLTLNLKEANDAMVLRNDALETLNRTLADTQGQLVQSEKLASVGQLAAGVAHEINNPIGYVRCNIGTLRDYVHRVFGILDAYDAVDHAAPEDTAAARRGVADAKAAADLDFMRGDALMLIDESLDGISRVDRIVQDLKSFSRIDSNDWQFADLHLGLESTLNVAAPELKYKADIVKQYGPAPDVECLPFQINQVFLNLLVNAGQAIEERGTIIIRTGGDAFGAWVQIQDDGAGIPPEHQTRVFEPFFTTKPVGVGTGLGLSVSYGIVQKHGGTIEVDSEVGKGTTFTVRLPLRRPDADAASRASTTS